VEFRANNLFKQLTMRMGYSFSKNLDNVSEIFSTFGGGNSLAYSQNPFNSGAGEYSYSGLDFPNTWTVLFTEELPFFKEQHGFMGHLLGGWGLSGDYIIASGQRYTPVQGSELALFTAPGNFYDSGFINNFVGTDIARPFLGSLNAPASAVGIFGGDACALFGSAAACNAPANQLLSLNQLNISGQAVSVNNNQVRYIMNGGESQSIFGTPFGTARNLSSDAISNIGNFSMFKSFKLGERASFQMHATMLNVFNHQNFQTIDPFVEDAGVVAQGTGFGNPSVQNTTPAGFQAPANREIIFGGTIRF
jgi:hypothetical protein